MSLNSIKILSLTMALLAVVACGKDNRTQLMKGANKNKINKIAGNSNDLIIDGHYKVVAEDRVELAHIKNNLMIRYTFSADKKSVEVSKQQLTIKDKKIVKSEDIDQKCRVGATLENTFDLDINQDRLQILDSSNVESIEDAIVLEEFQIISETEFNTALSGVITGKIPVVCLDENGKIKDTLNGTEIKDVVHAEGEAAAQDEEETATDAKATDDAATADQAEDDKTQDDATENNVEVAADATAVATEETSAPTKTSRTNFGPQ